MSVSTDNVEVNVSSNQTVPVQHDDELVVPLPPLTRSQTKKPDPMNLHMVFSICGKSLKEFGNAKLSASTILLLLQKIIKVAKDITKLKGDDLKQISLESIHWLIENQKSLSDSEKDLLDVLSENAFSQTFDMIVELESGCFSFCFGKSKRSSNDNDSTSKNEKKQ